MQRHAGEGGNGVQRTGTARGPHTQGAGSQAQQDQAQDLKEVFQNGANDGLAAAPLETAEIG